jgi:hypothetical protein
MLPHFLLPFSRWLYPSLFPLQPSFYCIHYIFTAHLSAFLRGIMRKIHTLIFLKPKTTVKTVWKNDFR